MSLKNRSNGWALIYIALAAVLTTGCRQNPSDEPKYYQRELAAMQREEKRVAAEKAEKKASMKDGYPWRGRTSENCLPCRIKVSEKVIAEEIRYLHETVHGKAKTRLRLRD